MESKQGHHIGMFDSGIGGLTVMRAIQNKLPFEKIVYFADTARLPYGEKSPETVLRYSIENAVFLMEQDIKILVVACSTASSVSVEKLRKIFNIPVIGTIEPGAERAVQVSKTGKIAILGTKGTIQSGTYQNELRKRLPKAHLVPIACPLLAPVVEEGMQNHEIAKLLVKEYLKPLRTDPVDTIILGCTHYPLLEEIIQEEVGDAVQIVDSAATCADTVAEILQTRGMNNTLRESISHQFFVSDNPEKFHRLGQQYIGQSIPEAKLYSFAFRVGN